MSTENSAGFDEKSFLGGRVLLRQLRRGHRAGTDAALAIAAARPDAHGRVVDLGAGSGAIGLSLAVLAPKIEVTLVEVDAEIAGLAAESAVLNGCAERVQCVVADVEHLIHSPRTRHDLGPLYDLVVTNPPFTNAQSSQASPNPRRALAHMTREGALARWIDAGAVLLRPKGSLIVICRPEAITEALEALRRSFSGIALRPVHPRVDASATRILVRAQKGGRAPLTILPPLVLHEEDASFTRLAEAIHRGDAELGFH